MNKRIEELAKQSGAFFIPYSKDYFGEEYPPKISTRDMDFEKFAELIIRECIDVLNPEGDLTSMREEAGRNLAINMIKEHFGIKDE